MFSLSSRAVYGLLAMIELAQTHKTGPIQIKDIARTHEIPQHYLEQLLVVLRKAGFADSRRGVRGGYELAIHPSQIRVGEILACLDGKLEVVADRKKSGALNFFWMEIESGISELLDRSLEDLLLEKQKSEQNFSYSI